MQKSYQCANPQYTCFDLFIVVFLWRPGLDRAALSSCSITEPQPPTLEFFFVLQSLAPLQLVLLSTNGDLSVPLCRSACCVYLCLKSKQLAFACDQKSKSSWSALHSSQPSAEPKAENQRTIYELPEHTHSNKIWQLLPIQYFTILDSKQWEQSFSCTCFHYYNKFHLTLSKRLWCYNKTWM